MRERLITLGGAILALFTVYMLLFPAQPGPEPQGVSFPTSEDTGRYGLAGARTWLAQAGFNTFSLQERYHALHEYPQLPESGNLLIMSLPQRIESREWEEQELMNWLSRGNSLLLLLALNDDPDWYQYARGTIYEQLNLFNLQMKYDGTDTDDDLEIETPDDAPTDEADARPETRQLIPAVTHPLNRTISAIHVEVQFPNNLGWRISGDEQQRSLLPLLHDRETGKPAFWLGRYNNSHLLISQYHELFGNLSLGEADNARLLANLVNLAVAGDGYVVFDDMHQGLSILYDPTAFFSDSRLHQTLWFIFILWLVYLLGHTNRFQPLLNTPEQLHLVDHIKAIGIFLGRRLRSAALAQRMLWHFFNEIRHYHGLAKTGQPVWNKLSSYPQIEAKQLAQLQEFYQQAERNQRINLIRLGRLINSIRNKLS